MKTIRILFLDSWVAPQLVPMLPLTTRAERALSMHGRDSGGDPFGGSSRRDLSPQTWRQNNPKPMTQTMKTRLRNHLQTLALLLLTLIVAAGCASTQSTGAKPLKPTLGANVDLRKYAVATVTPFAPSPGRSVDAAVGLQFAGDIAARLQRDFGTLFRDVRTEAPLGKEDELIVTGTIKTYRPGSRFGRFMLIGVGSAGFEADLVLQDAGTKQQLLSAPINKLWAWGGMLGASKGIEDMVQESAAAAANTIARAKGWTPSNQSQSK